MAAEVYTTEPFEEPDVGPVFPATNSRKPLREPCRGSRAELPPPRRLAFSTKEYAGRFPRVHRNELPRCFDDDLGNIDVIYADDETLFHDIAEDALTRLGISEKRLFFAENGLEALERLLQLQSQNLTQPLVMLLDVRMPGMDGRECAMLVQEHIARGELIRNPFVACISSTVEDGLLAAGEGKGNFQEVISKSFSEEDLRRVFQAVIDSWCGNVEQPRQLPAWKRWNLREVDVIVCDDEEAGRMCQRMLLEGIGVSPDRIVEAEHAGELMRILEDREMGEAVESVPDLGPLMVFLDMVMPGRSGWEAAREIHGHWDGGRLRREPFMVCISVTGKDVVASPQGKQLFHGFMPKSCNDQDMRYIIELCRLWYQTRGDGPGFANFNPSGKQSNSYFEGALKI